MLRPCIPKQDPLILPGIHGDVCLSATALELDEISCHHKEQTERKRGGAEKESLCTTTEVCSTGSALGVSKVPPVFLQGAPLLPPCRPRALVPAQRLGSWATGHRHPPSLVTNCTGSWWEWEFMPPEPRQRRRFPVFIFERTPSSKGSRTAALTVSWEMGYFYGLRKGLHKWLLNTKRKTAPLLPADILNKWNQSTSSTLGLTDIMCPPRTRFCRVSPKMFNLDLTEKQH